jgi:uncharacterized protein (DUF433 family)
VPRFGRRSVARVQGTERLLAEEGSEVMSQLTDIGKLIVRSDDIRGGRPRLAGTGVTVQRIVGWYKLGLSPEEISERVGHLSLAQVHAALAYYHANQEEVEADMAAEEAETRRLEGSHTNRETPSS